MARRAEGSRAVQTSTPREEMERGDEKGWGEGRGKEETGRRWIWDTVWEVRVVGGQG